MTSDVKYFDIDNFEAQWKKSTEKQQAIIVQQSGFLKPSKGIIPVLAGYFSPNKSIKKHARASLDALLKKIKALMANRHDPARKYHHQVWI